MTQPLTVYVLLVDGVARYVGQSKNPAERLRQHKWDAGNRGDSTFFLRKLRKAIHLGCVIEQEIIASGLTQDDANAREIQEIFERGGHTGASRQLWNTHKGGVGGASPASTAVLRKKWKTDDGFRKSQSERARETLQKTRENPAIEANRIEATRRYRHSAAGLESLERARSRIDRTKQKSRVSEWSKKQWADPEYRAKRIEGLARGLAKRWGKQ